MHSPIHHPQSLIMYLQSSVCPISDHPKWEYLTGRLQEVVVCKKGNGGSTGGGGGPGLPLFLDQTEARGAEKTSFGDRPPPVTSRPGWPAGPPPLPYPKVWISHWIIRQWVSSERSGHVYFMKNKLLHAISSLQNVSFHVFIKGFFV